MQRRYDQGPRWCARFTLDVRFLLTILTKSALSGPLSALFVKIILGIGQFGQPKSVPFDVPSAEPEPRGHSAFRF